MFRRITAAVLFVEDFEACFKFYSEQVGLEVAMREPAFAAFRMDDQDFAIQGLDQSADMVNLKTADFEPQTGKTDRVLLCTRVDNVDEVYETLKSRGVPFTREPADEEWGLRCTYFTDPEGNIWEIAHSLAG